MHSQLQISTSNCPLTLVFIDSNRSIYESKDVIDPLMTKFIEKLQVETRYFYFLFNHKNMKKNLEHCSSFNEKCQKNKLSIKKQIIATQNIFETMTEKIQQLLVKNNYPSALPSPLPSPRNEIIPSMPQALKDKIIIVTHNPSKIKFAKLTKFLYDSKYLKSAEVHYFYFSSYLQDLHKKQTIEDHFYNNNFGRSQYSYKFSHISHLLQILPNLAQNFIDNRVTVGYYFYHKKQNELLTNGVLLDSKSVNLVPVDLRYYNLTQYKFLKVFFHRVFDLNKAKEIQFKSNEIELFKRNYDRFIREVKIKNIDPIEMIPIIAQRMESSKLFDDLLSTDRALDLMKQNGHKIRTPNYNEISNTTHQNGNIQYHFPSIVKTKAAAFTPNCHTMAIVINDDGLKQILQQEEFKCDLMFQEIVNHDGVIYKVYCLGSNVIVQKRKSIPNIEQSNFRQCYQIFDSQKDLFKQVCECLIDIIEPDLEPQPKDLIFQELFQGLSEMIREHFQIELFGFDIIVNSKTQDLNIIDINHFPGYKNVANIKDMFDELFIQQ